MKTALATLSTALLATPAVAHPGHFAEVAGHSHWIALGALAAAGLIAAGLLGKKAEADDAETSEPEAGSEDRPGEAPA